MEIKNFGANVVFRPKTHFVPKSEDEVLKILKKCRGRRIRAIGRLHSWSDAPREDDVLLDLRKLNAIHLEQRGDETWATIQAGCQIKQVVAELERRAGVTLPSIGLITEQAIAGAVSTGTHGSGKHSLSHYADEISLAVYDKSTGEPVIRTVKGGPELPAARCALGCMGIVLSVGVRCRPQYRVEEHFRSYADLAAVLKAEEVYPLQQFFLIPHLWQYLVQHRRESDQPRSWLAPIYRLYWLLGIDVGMHLIILTLSRALHIGKLITGYYRHIAPKAVIRGWKVVDKSYAMLTMEHELFRHIEIEVFVKRSRLAAALSYARQLLSYCAGESHAIDEATWGDLTRHGLADAVRPLLGSYTHNYPICIRRILPDSTLISMASSEDEDYYSVSFICYDRVDQREDFFKFADAVARSMALLMEGRPHWGKYCPLDAQLANQLYPELSEFRRICDEFDPEGVFRNRWLAGLLFAESAQLKPGGST